MHTPEVVSIRVVLTGKSKKMFQLPDGSLRHNITAGKYGSWKAYDENDESSSEKEVDTAFVVFRNGELFDRGVCTYIFGADGYHVVEGMTQIDTQHDHLAFMEAKWFEGGDVISFIRTPSKRELSL